MVAPAADGDLRAWSHPELGAPDDPDPEGLTRPLEPGPRVGRLDRVHHDPLVPELGGAEQRLQPPEERLVGAVVDPEGLGRARRLGRPEVGHDVAAAEGVDGLLGVADEHHGRRPGERPVEDLPLHRVGVLELVDQHDLPAVPHPGAGRGVLVGQRVGELHQQVVVAQHAQSSLAGVDLGEHVEGELHPCRRLGVGRLGERLPGLDDGPRVADDLAGDPQRHVARPRRGAVPGEAGEVEVVDHLGGELVEVLDQGRGRVGVAGHPQAAEHELAELVDRGDRRRIEGDERVGEAARPPTPLLVVGVEQPRVQVVGPAVADGVVEHVGRLDERRTHPLAQLLAGRAGEGHHEHLVEGRLARGDVLGDERGDGPRLAGAGTRLQQRGAGGQWVEDGEGVHSDLTSSCPSLSNGPQVSQL